jgi:hypothetical protein
MAIVLRSSTESNSSREPAGRGRSDPPATRGEHGAARARRRRFAQVPPDIHLERDDCEAKFWLDPVRLERSRGFRRKEINRIPELVVEHRRQLLGELG